MLLTVWFLCGPLLAVYGSAENCAQRTTGTECCEFPFMYEGHSYSSCIVGGLSTTPWCATTPDYDRDGQWNHCEGITCYSCSSMESWSDCVNRQYTLTCPYYYDRCMQFEDAVNSTQTFFRKCAMEKECSATQCRGKTRTRCDLLCCMDDLCNAGSQNHSVRFITFLCFLVGWIMRYQV